jgi:GNAT superfamily N-acetyltransferase
MNFTIQASGAADDSVRKIIVEQLMAYNASKTGRNDYKPVVVTVTDESETTLGGLWGRTAYDWLFVELLFVPASLRGRGVGSELMRRAETEAIARGCHNAWLDTFEFQARGFYERLGYVCFGELENYPAGTRRYFMRKSLERFL